jgi:hypothetical protein
VNAINRHRFPLAEALCASIEVEALPGFERPVLAVLIHAEHVDQIDGWRSLSWRTRPHWMPEFPGIPSIFD